MLDTTKLTNRTARNWLKNIAEYPSINKSMLNLTFPKARKFQLHYNKPLSRQRGYTVISLHVADTCHFVRNIDVKVPTKGKVRKRQPFFVMEGYAKKVVIDEQEVATVE